MRTWRPPSNFYPRSPRGERPCWEVTGVETYEISIHAPREGSDIVTPGNPAGGHISIHAPREGSDVWVLQKNTYTRISIHAPREGSDQPAAHRPRHQRDFYPRSPREERLVDSDSGVKQIDNFYPRSP